MIARALALTLLTGCLTLTRRDSQPVRVEGLPEGAQIIPLEDDLWAAQQARGQLPQDPEPLSADEDGRFRAERRLPGLGEVWVGRKAFPGTTWPDRYYLFQAEGYCSAVTRFQGRITPLTVTTLTLETLLLVPLFIDLARPERSYSLRPRAQGSPLTLCAAPQRVADLTVVHIHAKGPAKIGLLTDVNVTYTGTGSLTTYRYHPLGEAPLDLEIPLGQTPRLWMWRGKRMNSSFFHGERLKINSNGVEQEITVRAPRGVLGDFSVYGLSFGLSSMLTAGLLKVGHEPNWRPWAWGGAGLAALSSVGIAFSTARVKPGQSRSPALVPALDE